MNTWAKRGSISHAKYFGTNWGKKRNQIANHAAAAAPRRPQPNRDRRAVSIPSLPSPDRTARSARAYASTRRPASRTPVAPPALDGDRYGQDGRRAALARTTASWLRRPFSRARQLWQ